MRALTPLFSLVGLLLIGPGGAAAQSAPTATFTPDAVWGASTQARPTDSYRSGSGHPGPNYWQNHVDYTIEAQLDTAAHVLRGSVQYTYTNNSPSPLHSIWLLTGGPTSSGPHTHRGASSSSIRLENVTVDGKEEKQTASTYTTRTRTQVRLSVPVSAQGGTITFSLDYQVPLSLDGPLPTRTHAPSGTIYEIGHWYPRVAAYSEQRGWTEAPAHRPTDALSEYGSYNYSITVPARLIIAGSGTLMNPNTVLTSDQRRRLMRARDSNGKVAIITPDQAGSPDTRPKQKGLMTWKYQMNGVRDVAWAGSSAFIWNAARINRKEHRDGLAMSFYPRSSMGGQAWNRSTYHTQKAMTFFSDRLKTYPWNTTVNVAVPIGNQSFPGMSFCSRSSTGDQLFSCTVRNLSRNWFPVMVGSNEERHPWMDEGLSTALSVLAHRSLYDGEFAPKHDSSFAPGGNSPANGLLPLMTTPEAGSITTPPSLQPEQWQSLLASYKSAYGLLLLREYILDPDRFDYALRQYVRRWAYRQPTPRDFFHTMNDATGEDLSWFWTAWFKQPWALDQAVTDVSYQNGNAENGALITIELRRRMPMPVEAEISESDGDTRTVRFPVEIWKQGGSQTVHVETDSRLKSVRLDPSTLLPDANSSNDTWSPDPPIGSASGSP